MIYASTPGAGRRLVTTVTSDVVAEIPESLDECKALLSELGYGGCDVWRREDDRLLVSHKGRAFTILFDFEDDIVSVSLLEGWPL